MTSLTLRERLSLYGKLMRVDKPIGALLLAWPTLWGLWFASDGHPDWRILLIFSLGIFLTRSAGCVINDYADRDFDPHVERTRHRPLAARLVSPREALLLAGGLALLAFLSILPLQNLLLIELSFAAAFLAASYPFTKRFFAIPQAYLGVAFGFGIPMAFAAEQGTIPGVAWILLLANVAWSIAYDTEYAMVDRADDLKIGIQTSAITFGRFDVAIVMLCYLASLSLLAYAGGLLGMGKYFLLGIAIAAGVALYHYTLIRERQPGPCFKAFLHNNWFGGAVFAGIVLDYLFR